LEAIELAGMETSEEQGKRDLTQGRERRAGRA
jgi:hypothetical protein